MDFIFNINTDDKQDNNDLEDILNLMEGHFEDWNNFYNLYTMFAPPPTENSKQIQQWFKELKESFIKIVEQYNNKVNKFADVVDVNEDRAQDIANDFLKQMSKSKSKDKKDDTKTNTMMWG
tara:strand:- start:503 stop:865 length:363 start_codon:yes stop_codon:yes gene_type:complete